MEKYPLYTFNGRKSMIAAAYRQPILFRKAVSLWVLQLYLVIRKNPEVMIKKGTAVRAIIRVNIKSASSLYVVRGEVWFAMIRNDAINLK